MMLAREGMTGGGAEAGSDPEGEDIRAWCSFFRVKNDLSDA